MIKILALTKKNWSVYNSRLQELEHVAEYPYGNDFFKLNHGISYFSFFERLGEPIFHIAVDGERVVACASGVLRDIPTSSGILKSWYLCDLKVHPSYRSHRIPTKLFRKNLFFNYLRCGRAYAVSMNPNQGENRVVKMTEKLPYFPIGLEAQLNIFSLNWQQMKNASRDIQKIVGPLSYLSLAGKKDLIMKSTGERLDLLHVQHGPLAEMQLMEPQQNSTHMICALQGSPLDLVLTSTLEASATASIISYRMNGTDWNFVLTSDI